MSFLLECNSLEELDTIADYLYFNRPLLFSCRNSAGEKFLAGWVEETNDFECYLCVPISRERLEALETGAIEIREAFLQSEAGYAYEVKVPRKNIPDLIAKIPCDRLNADWLPPAGASLKREPQVAPVLAE